LRLIKHHILTKKRSPQTQILLIVILIKVDDTSARHLGKTGVCTHIGNPWFESTEPKVGLIFFNGCKRISQNDYILKEEALVYILASPISVSEQRQGGIKRCLVTCIYHHI